MSLYIRPYCAYHEWSQVSRETGLVCTLQSNLWCCHLQCKYSNGFISGNPILDIMRHIRSPCWQEITDGRVVRAGISVTYSTVMIWRSWVWTPVGLNSGCVVLLSKVVLEPKHHYILITLTLHRYSRYVFTAHWFIHLIPETGHHKTILWYVSIHPFVQYRNYK